MEAQITGLAYLLFFGGYALADILQSDLSEIDVKVDEIREIAGTNSAAVHSRTKRGTSGSRLTYAERVDFLNAHNEYRRNVTPTAADMTFMVWHEELAAMAQEWADECQFMYGQPLRDPPPFPNIGQNVYADALYNLTGSAVTTYWYNEVEDYDFTTDTCAEGYYCKNYEQVVWAKSNYLGCAINFCPVLQDFDYINAQIVVCNYAPGGDVFNDPPYTNGDSCSMCPSGTDCEDKLCVPYPKCFGKICENGGVLDPVSCECNCPDGFDGATCDTVNGVPYPMCSGKICENGGVLDPVSCECNCPDGFDGATCDAVSGVPYPICSGKICENGGVLDPVSCECNCPDGFDGATCDAVSGGSPVQSTRWMFAATCLLVLRIYL